jgi:hypothetical protein
MITDYPWNYIHYRQVVPANMGFRGQKLPNDEYAAKAWSLIEGASLSSEFRDLLLSGLHRPEF